MTTNEYREAAHLLRGLRATLLAEHALRLPPSFPWRQRSDVWFTVGSTLFWHDYLGVPYSTTYEVVRQNRDTILNSAPE